MLVKLTIGRHPYPSCDNIQVQTPRIRELIGRGERGEFYRLQIRPLCRRDTQFLLELSDERLVLLLTGFHMPAEDIPDIRVELSVCRALAEQYLM
jgi:hypothetical protein